MQSGPHGHLPADAFASLARLRVKEPARRAKLAIDDFRNKPTLNGLNDAVIFTCDLIKRVSEVANENLACTFNTDILLMMIDSVHKIVDLAKVPSVADSLGKENVINALEKFSTLIDKMMEELKSADIVPNWVHESSLENLRDAFLVRNCQIRGKLTPEEKMAHYFLFLLKGDLLRYKFNLQNEPYIGVSKAYWSSYCFAPEHGNLLKLLAIVALNRDRGDFLGQIFYITRALSAGKPFEACTENLTAALGSITEKMVKSDYGKYYKCFENPSIYDNRGILASKIDPSQPTVFFFVDEIGLQTVDPRWKRNISRLTKPALRRMTFDSFLHLMNMAIHKLSHEITFNTASMFICFFQHMLEESFILGKEVVQLVSIYLYGLSKRISDTGDETYMIITQTFVTIVGFLLAKLYDAILDIGEKAQENDAVVFPEHIFATLSNRLATEINAFKLKNGAENEDSLTFKTFLMRASLIVNFMFNLTEKQFFGLAPDLSLLPIPIYPEFIVIDTNTVIDEYQKIGDIVISNVGSFKVVLTTVGE
ncbi:hypothetical protein FO519_007431 [Halicephalobus sp. NKZ332]|nr:hypothetical protein FO519_007431 [Halicephalobus sp. NKZ332]